MSNEIADGATPHQDRLKPRSPVERTPAQLVFYKNWFPYITSKDAPKQLTADFGAETQRVLHYFTKLKSEGIIKDNISFGVGDSIVISESDLTAANNYHLKEIENAHDRPKSVRSK